jgi:hypothetical protein
MGITSGTVDERVGKNDFLSSVCVFFAEGPSGLMVVVGQLMGRLISQIPLKVS